MYGHNGLLSKYPEITNAIAVEFDMQNNLNEFDPNLPISGPHIAITEPISPTSTNKFVIRHDALSAYPAAQIMNDQYHRVIINWEHRSSGVDLLPNTDDDIYVLTYRIFAGDTPEEGETATVSGSQQYTRAYAQSVFKTDQVRLAITGSSGAAITQMQVAFPTIYDYTVQYMVQDKEGNPTNTLVPGITTGFAEGGEGAVPQEGGTLNPIPGKTSRSTIDLAPLPPAPPGFELVQGQTTLKYVSDNPAHNVFSFYYRPAYIAYKVHYYMEDGSHPAGSEVYQHIFTEDPPQFVL